MNVYLHYTLLIFLLLAQHTGEKNREGSFESLNKKRSSIQRKTFFVSPEGDDSNQGSLERPFRTITAAEKKMAVNDICLIRRGTYRESVIVTKDRLTFKNYKDEEVIVTGLDAVNGWSKHSANIYKTQFIPDDKDASASPRHLGKKGGLLTQVFLNRKPLIMARYPNLKSDILDWEDHGAEVKIFPDGQFTFNSGKQNWADNFWTGAVFDAIVEKKFAAVQGIVAAQHGNEFTCGERTSGWKSSTNQDFKKFIFTQVDGETSGIGRGFITNHLNALDGEKEWFWDKNSNTLYVWIPGGGQPEPSAIEAQSRTIAFTIQDRTGVTLQGLTIMAAGIEMKNTNTCVVDRCSILYPVGYFIHNNEYDSYCSFNISEGKGNIVKNSRIAYSWGAGISITKGTDDVVENTLIEDVNWMGTYGGNIQLGGRGTIIKGNTLRRSGRFLIYGIGVKAGKILNNDMYDCMLIGQDGGAFYTNGALGEGTEIAYNWIHNIQGVPWERAPDKDHNLTIGLYLDGGCKDFNIHHNVIWKTKFAVLLNPFTGNPPKSVEGNKVNNNTCLVTGQSSIVTQNSKLYSNNEMSNNLTNRKVGAIGEKIGNEMDDSQEFENKYFRNGEFSPEPGDKLRGLKSARTQSTEAGANAGGKFWKPGIDSAALKKPE